jgi:hypothetical protein
MDLVPSPVPVAIAPAAAPAATASATVLSPAATATASLFRSIATLAVNRTIATRFKGYGRGLPAAGADHGCARAHSSTSPRTGAVAAALVRMGWCVTTAGGVLLCLAAWLAASGRGVAALLKELLFTCSEGKFLTAVATGKYQVAAAHGFAPFSECTKNAPRAQECYTQKSLGHTCLWISAVSCTARRA